MNRSKIVAIITGVFSLILAIAYLLLVQILDFRGEMKPAPISEMEQPVSIVTPSSTNILIS
ncbi:hypothetical protein [Fischerella sp. JS2]|uniref:hypothetical protein n=1 Tax=Fischerella sp. JS2 TaxID=2597771 RepID=UPI0028F0E27C|nr:hypothetical protein [Fischerella sp. JS2]